MTDDIKDILQKHLKKNYGDRDWYSPMKQGYEFYEHLKASGEVVEKKDRESHRWWDEYTVVKKFELEGSVYYIGYRDAHSTRDMSAQESGWEFDPDTVKQYKPKKITTVTYEPI